MEFEEREEHEEEEEEDEEEDEDESDESDEEIELPVGLNERLIRMSNSGGEAAVVSPTIRKVRYRECLKNHAVGIGGHAVDGCGEFMPAGTEGTLDALKCAACNCHRNFHRKENEVAAIISAGGEGTYHRQQQQHQQQQQQFSHYYRPQTGYLHMGAPHHRPPPLALPSTSGEGRGPMSRDGAPDQEDRSNPNNGSGGGGTTTMMMTSGSGSSKKRFRTKFTNEQKDRMVTLAERLGWRIQKHDEEIVQQFCNESGVKRHVLKVWMHNNKHTLGKKSA